MFAVAGVTICPAAAPYFTRAAVVILVTDVARPVTPETSATDQPSTSSSKSPFVTMFHGPTAGHQPTRAATGAADPPDGVIVRSQSAGASPGIRPPNRSTSCVERFRYVNGWISRLS